MWDPASLPSSSVPIWLKIKDFFILSSVSYMIYPIISQHHRSLLNTIQIWKCILFSWIMRDCCYTRCAWLSLHQMQMRHTRLPFFSLGILFHLQSAPWQLAFYFPAAPAPREGETQLHLEKERLVVKLAVNFTTCCTLHHLVTVQLNAILLEVKILKICFRYLFSSRPLCRGTVTEDSLECGFYS